MSEIDYGEIETHFAVHGYLWKIDGQLRFPTDDDIRLTVERAVTMLSKEPNGASLEVGRLLIKKSSTNYDVYVMIGEVA